MTSGDWWPKKPSRRQRRRTRPSGGGGCPLSVLVLIAEMALATALGYWAGYHVAHALLR
jgi:hypothetical protein